MSSSNSSISVRISRGQEGLRPELCMCGLWNHVKQKNLPLSISFIAQVLRYQNCEGSVDGLLCGCRRHLLQQCTRLVDKERRRRKRQRLLCCESCRSELCEWWRGGVVAPAAL